MSTILAYIPSPGTSTTCTKPSLPLSPTSASPPRDRYLIVHGGLGSTKEEIATAVSNGLVKMNFDTDTQ